MKFGTRNGRLKRICYQNDLYLLNWFNKDIPQINIDQWKHNFRIETTKNKNKMPLANNVQTSRIINWQLRTIYDSVKSSFLTTFRGRYNLLQQYRFYTISRTNRIRVAKSSSSTFLYLNNAWNLMKIHFLMQCTYKYCLAKLYNWRSGIYHVFLL